MWKYWLMEPLDSRLKCGSRETLCFHSWRGQLLCVCRARLCKRSANSSGMTKLSSKQGCKDKPNQRNEKRRLRRSEDRKAGRDARDAQQETAGANAERSFNHAAQPQQMDTSNVSSVPQAATPTSTQTRPPGIAATQQGFAGFGSSDSRAGPFNFTGREKHNSRQWNAMSDAEQAAFKAAKLRNSK